MRKEERKKIARCPVCWMQISRKNRERIKKEWVLGDFPDLMLEFQEKIIMEEEIRGLREKIKKMEEEIVALKAVMNPQIHI